MKKGEHTRLAVLDLACLTAARMGLEGLSIGKLASELGMSKSGLFAHFKSKEALQIQVLEHDSERFINEVIRPALRASRGETRVVALFDRWMDWFNARAEVGCFFIAAAAEMDDRPGVVRDRLAEQQQDWIDFMASVAKTAVVEGDFKASLDVKQFAFELYGLVMSLHLSFRLLKDPHARSRARRAFETLLSNSRTS